MKVSSRLLAVALLVTPMVGNAVAVQTSTGNRVTYRTCIGPPEYLCGWLSEILQESYGGEPGGLSAVASLESPDFGSAYSNTALSGRIGEPILRTTATSLPGQRVNTNSFALQHYTYAGIAATSRTYGGTLEYVQNITDPNNDLYGTASSGVFAWIRVFTSSADLAEAGSTAESNFNNLLAFADGGAPGFEMLGEDIYSDHFDAAAGSVTLGVDVTLNPGDTVWVWAFLQTPAADGSIVDASDTFVTRWSDTTDLIPANVYVPEPGTLTLFALGLAGLGLRRRRNWGRCAASAPARVRTSDS